MDIARLITDYHVFQFLLLIRKFPNSNFRVYLDSSIKDKYTARLMALSCVNEVVELKWKGLPKIVRKKNTLASFLLSLYYRNKCGKNILITSQHNHYLSTVSYLFKNRRIILSEGYQDGLLNWRGKNIFYSKISFLDYRLNYWSERNEIMLRQSIPKDISYNTNVVMISDLLKSINKCVLDFYSADRNVFAKLERNMYDGLFLSQPLLEDGECSEIEYESLMSQLISELRSHGVSCLLVKQHPRERIFNFEFPKDIKVTYIDKNLPIEIISELIKVKLAVTFYSTSINYIKSAQIKINLINQ